MVYELGGTPPTVIIWYLNGPLGINSSINVARLIPDTPRPVARRPLYASGNHVQPGRINLAQRGVAAQQNASKKHGKHGRFLQVLPWKMAI